MSLPRELNLGSNKPLASSARPQILRFRSDNSTYGAGDTIRIEIPTNRQGQYLFPTDSFLEFKLGLNVTQGAAAQNYFLDQSIYSLFYRMRILHGSTVLEDTMFCNRLWTVLYDIQVNEAERRADCITKGVYDTTAVANTSIYNPGLFGRIAVSTGAAAGTGDYIVDTFNFVIPSALFGTLAQKALPLSLLGASSIYIEFELAPINTVFTKQTQAADNGSLNSYTVSDIYYNAKVSVLPIEIEQVLIASTGGIINLPAVAYKCEQKTIGAASTSFNDKFSFQYSSMKNFLFWVSNQASTTDILKRSISARPKANISEFYLNINGELFPTQSITGYARQYTELMRSFDMLTDTNAGGILTFSNYSYDTSTTGTDIIETNNFLTTTKQKRWVSGIDLDRFNRSSDVLMSGTSTIGQMLSLVVNMSVGNAEALNLYGACMYDVLFHIENGQLTAKV